MYWIILDTVPKAHVYHTPMKLVPESWANPCFLETSHTLPSCLAQDVGLKMAVFTNSPRVCRAWRWWTWPVEIAMGMDQVTYEIAGSSIFGAIISMNPSHFEVNRKVPGFWPIAMWCHWWMINVCIHILYIYIYTVHVAQASNPPTSLCVRCM